MKRIVFFLLAVALMTACEKPIETDAEATATVTNENDDKVIPAGTPNTKKFTFTMKGDFSSEWKPVTKSPRRAVGYLSSDGRDMTDVWVLDYVGGALVQQLHQTSEDADFGRPVLNLAYGSHHVYFIAARGANPVLDQQARTITFTKVYDTFWKDYAVDVVSTSNGNRAVTLDRVITKLRMTMTDAIPVGTASIHITPSQWYYGMNYQTAEPVAAATDKTIDITIPESSYGITEQSANIYSFSPATEWAVDVSFYTTNTVGDVVGQVSIVDVPLKRNRVTQYSGQMFGVAESTELSLNTEWDEQYNGVW